MPFADVSNLVAPRRVAVVGASERVGSFGNTTYRNVRDHSSVSGGVFAVNPRYTSVLGDPCYARVSDVPGGPLDVAIVLVGANLVVEVVRDCAKAGVSHVMVLASGFSEIGGAGVSIQNEIATIAREAGMHLYGPNSPGLSNITDQILLSMSPMAADDVRVGGVGLVTQGGGLGRAMLQWKERGLGFGLWASTGNEADLDISDFVNYMVEDDRLHAIGVVVEGFSDGPKFLEAARRARSKSKPVVVLKIGRSEYGQRSAASHTASIAGNDAVADAVFAQYGVTRVDDIDELAETLLLLDTMRKSGVASAARICVYSFSGGAASLAADLVGAAGLRLADFDPSTIAALAEEAPSFGILGNPIDLTTKVFTDPDLNRAVFERVCHDPGVDCVVFAMPADYGESTSTVARDCVAIAKETGTLLVPVWMSPRRGTGYHVLAESVMTPFGSVARAVRALRRVISCGAVQPPVSGSIAAPELAACATVALPHQEARQLVESGVVRFPRERFCRSAEEAADAVCQIGRATVMKLSAPGLVHKTDVGGVAVGLSDPMQAMHVFTTMTDPQRLGRFGLRADGVHVQEMVGVGVDVVLGVHEDEVFGPVLTVGTGGVGTEVENDVLHLSLPFDRDQFDWSLADLRLARYLAGTRGQPAYDVSVLYEAAHEICARYVAERDRIAEVEINPLRLVVGETGTEAVALDVVVMVRS